VSVQICVNVFLMILMHVNMFVFNAMELVNSCNVSYIEIVTNKLELILISSLFDSRPSPGLQRL